MTDRLPFITLGHRVRHHIQLRYQARMNQRLFDRAHGHLTAHLKNQADLADTGAPGLRCSESKSNNEETS